MRGNTISSRFCGRPAPGPTELRFGTDRGEGAAPTTPPLPQPRHSCNPLRHATALQNTGVFRIMYCTTSTCAALATQLRSTNALLQLRSPLVGAGAPLLQKHPVSYTHLTL